MSHFNIIEIRRERPAKDERISYSDIREDNLFLSESDYGGDPLTKEKFEQTLQKIKRQLKPVAYVNIRKRTIRFHKPDAVKKTFMKQVNKTVRSFRKMMEEGSYWTAEYSLREGVRELFSDDLFYNGYCQKLSQVLVDYLAGYTPQILYIGNILDAHC